MKSIAPFLLIVSTTLSAEPFPTENPPVLLNTAKFPRDSQKIQPKNALPVQEWVFHKTEDGLHPSGAEQELVWLMNRARQDPKAEGEFLATSNHSDIASGRNFFAVDTDLLLEEFNSYEAKAPAAFDRRLYLAAKTHSLDLISRDAQDHNNQFERIDDAGFSWSRLRGNVFSFGENSLHAHAAFNIDWGGNDGSGMQSGRGHRKAIMSLDADYTNAGFAIVEENDINTNVGPWVISENFAQALNGAADHYNRFLVGTVWKDLNANDRFDDGEGVANVKVTPNSGEFFAVTSAGGGFAIPILQDGEYTATFSEGGLTMLAFRTATVGSQSVLLDYQLETDQSVAQSNRLFAFAEQNFPNFFTPANQATMDYDGFIFRFYSNTNNYLATKEGRVYVLGDVFGGLVDVGAVTDFVD